MRTAVGPMPVWVSTRGRDPLAPCARCLTLALGRKRVVLHARHSVDNAAVEQRAA